MKRFLLVSIIATSIVWALAGCVGAPGNNPAVAHADGPSAAQKDPLVSAKKPVSARKTLTAFRSEQELTAYLHELAEKQKQLSRGAHGASSDAATLAQPAPAMASKSAGGAKDEESVTNVQQAGVDEGGIVKVHGDHLVVLRRGRLFTVAIGDGALNPVSTVNAYGPDIDPGGTWYDEMLVSADTIAVIGYSYQRGGTEVGLFGIDDAGKLSYRSTYHLRSNDYYSSRNYASRLIGSKLIFYSPLYIYPGAQDPYASFPAVRKWHKGATASEFHRIVSASQVYKPAQSLDSSYGLALHTVTICDLAHDDFDCKATSVLGPPGRVFYVSQDSVYIWMNSNVLVRSDTSGDGMWGAEVAAGDVALMRVPLDSFSDGSESVPSSRYRPLPKPNGYTFQNRFVGDYLLYGTGSGWGYPQKTYRNSLYALRWAGGGDVHELSLFHGVDRIEQLGSDAVVVGTDGQDLHFTAVRLGKWPAVADVYTRKGASQGELRSHGFFYKPDGQQSGILGLPISQPGRPGYRNLFDSSAAVLFLKNDSLHFREVGELEAQSEKAIDDGCRASCVDWYGNARPLFVHGRVIALLGYELVEGTVSNGRIHEMRRVNYAPQKLEASR